jgi:hypothetical protein
MIHEYVVMLSSGFMPLTHLIRLRILAVLNISQNPTGADELSGVSAAAATCNTTTANSHACGTG